MTGRRMITGFVAGALLAGCGDTIQPLEPASTAAALLSQGADAGLVRTTWPSAEDPGMPFYARIEEEHLLIVDEWLVVPFYRDPTCIPADFNLLDFFDVPGAFSCPHTVEGFGLWHGAPFVGAPKISQSQGLGAVPYWFVPAGAALEAMEDGVLTIGELASLPGRLVGHASHFAETIHPHPNPPFLGGGGHLVPVLIQTAQGTLEDSRRFQFQLTRVHGAVERVRLRFW